MLSSMPSYCLGKANQNERWNLLNIGCYCELNKHELLALKSTIRLNVLDCRRWQRKRLNLFDRDTILFSTISIFIKICCQKKADKKPIQGWYWLWVIKENFGDRFSFTYCIDVNIEQLISLSNKHNLYLQNILC